MSRMLTLEEVCEMVRSHRETVTRWIKAGRLKAYKLGGGKMLIPEADLLRFMEERAVNK
jgi:excisionase family DNA binding protein